MTSFIFVPLDPDESIMKEMNTMVKCHDVRIDLVAAILVVDACHSWRPLHCIADCCCTVMISTCFGISLCDGAHAFNWVDCAFNSVHKMTMTQTRRNWNTELMHSQQLNAWAPSHREIRKQLEIITAQQQCAMQCNALQLWHASTTRIAATTSIGTSWHFTMAFVSFMMDSPGSNGTNINLVIVDNYLFIAFVIDSFVRLKKLLQKGHRPLIFVQTRLSSVLLVRTLFCLEHLR